MDSQAPEDSIVFTDAYFGGNGDQSNNGCLTTGPYANWHMAIPEGHCLARSFDGGTKISSFVAPLILAMIISQSNDYDAFRQTIESTPHAAPHINIGGDMKTMYSPNDPLFFLHHSYMDKVWDSFQSKNNGAFMGAFDSDTNRNVNTHSILVPFNISVSEVLDISKLCYRYQKPLKYNPATNPQPPSNFNQNGRKRMPPSLQRDANVASDNTPILQSIIETNFVSRSNLSETFLLNSNGTLISHSMFSSNETAVSIAENILSSMVGSSNSVLQMKSQSFFDQTYSFDKNLITNRNPGPLDRKDSSKLRIPQPIEEAYINHMGLDLNAIRNIEGALAALYDLSNNS